MSEDTTNALQGNQLGAEHYVHKELQVIADQNDDPNSRLPVIDDSQCRTLGSSYCSFCYLFVYVMMRLYFSPTVSHEWAKHMTAVQKSDGTRLLKDDNWTIMLNGRYWCHSVKYFKRRKRGGLCCGTTAHTFCSLRWQQARSSALDDKNKQDSEYLDGNCATGVTFTDRMYNLSSYEWAVRENYGIGLVDVH